MNLTEELNARSGGKCEICESQDSLSGWIVAPKKGNIADEFIMACSTCIKQLESPETADPNHWRCLNSSIWSEVPAVQVASWRMLQYLKNTDWADDLLSMMYMEDEVRNWAQTGFTSPEDAIVHKDSNGNILQQGDSVVLIKDLDVKGANFTAKRGTAVRNINLVSDNPDQIEGKVEGQQIVILTQFVKKQ